MLNAEMWLLAIKIIFFLNTDLIFANYFINPSEDLQLEPKHMIMGPSTVMLTGSEPDHKIYLNVFRLQLAHKERYKNVTWKDAQNICNVTSIGDSVYAMTDYSELPENFMAWTSSRNPKSDWTAFYGCLDVAVDMLAIDVIKKKLNQYFPNSADAIESKSVFKCAYFCTTKGDVFTFFRYVCKCAYENELKSKLVEIPTCLFQDSTKNKNIDEVYSISRYSLPIFKFEKGLRTENIQKGGKETHKHQCLTKTNGTFTTNRCEALKMFTCDGGLIGYGTWTTAYHTCLVNHRSISKNTSKDLDTWLGFFMYEEDKANEQCVVIRKNNISQSLSYQYRPCSDRLPVLCKDESYQSNMITDSSVPNFDKTLTPILTDITEIQIPDLGEIVVVNVVLFGLCIIFVIMIIFRKRLASKLCQTATHKFNRNNRNPVVQTNGNSEKDREDRQNEKNSDCDNHIEPWELRHNMDELYKQGIVDVQSEETET